MQLQLSTWLEVESYLKTQTGIVMPIGSTEQHGPNGLVGTDAITAETIAEAVGDRTGAMVGPTIAVGMAHHHMEFAGSMTLKPSTLIAVIRDYVLSLADHGFTRFLFVNGHGGNEPTIMAAFYEIYSEARALRGDNAPDLRCKLMSWWKTPGISELSRELYGSAEGAHATPSEVAVTQFAYPDHIKSAELNPKIAPVSAFFDARDFRRRHPDGRMGSDPSLASPEAGGRLVEKAADGLAEIYRSFLAER